MNKKNYLPLQLMQTLCARNGFVFIDDLHHYTDQEKIPGCTIVHPDCESHGIKANNTGKELWFQSEWCLLGNHVEAQLREYDNDTREMKRCDRVLLSDLFPEGVDIVITIGSENLRRFAPVFKKKSDLDNYLSKLHNFYDMWEYMGGSLPSFHWYSDMKELAEFLYEANKED